MLLKLADGFDVRYSGKIVQVNELDITIYMSAPNWVNTRNAHVGTIFRLYFPIEKKVSVERIGTSWLYLFAKFKELWEKWDYTGAAHDKKKILEVLRRENARIREVVDWPESVGISGGKEFDGYLRWATEEYEFFPPLKHSYSTELPGCCTIRYQVKVAEKFKRSLNLFTQDERDFLEQYQLVRTFLDEGDTELSTEHQKLLSDYTIDGLYIHSSSVEKINQLAAGVPFLLRNYENLSKKIKAKLTPAGVATFDYLKSINQNDYSFNSNGNLDIVAKVATILESDGRIWEFTAENSTAAFIRLVDSLKKKLFTDYHHQHFRYVALSYEKLMQLTNDETFLPEEFNKGCHILVINCGHLDNIQKRRIKKLKRWLQQSNTNVKLILIYSSNSIWSRNCDIRLWEWKDLSTDTKRRLMGKRIFLQGKYVVLSSILFNMGRPENLTEKDLSTDFKFKLGQSDIMRLIASDSLTVSVGGQPPRISELEAAFVKCGNSIADKYSVVQFIEQCNEKDVAFCISLVGLSSSSSSSPLDDSLRRIVEQNNNNVHFVRIGFMGNNFFEENEQNFKLFCKENQLQRAYWLSIIKNKTKPDVWEWKLEMIFDANFFVNRNIYRVAVNEFVRGNLSEFKFHNFQSAETIRSRLNISHQVLSDETLQNQMISQTEPFGDADLDTIPVNEMKYILMSSEHFPKEFVLYQKPSEDNLDVFHGINIFLLVDEPGMGKSTTLVKLGEGEYESYWVVHISLRNCNFKETTAQNLQNFLWSHGCGNEKDLLEKALFHFRLQHIKQVEKPFLFLIDGYDEIQTTEFQNHVAGLLQELSKNIVNTNHRMIVATRRYPPLEETLKVPFTLQFLGFDSLQQKAYLINAWKPGAQLLMRSWDDQRSETFISELLRQAGAILSQQGTKFISIPLQLRLMSVAFFENYLNYLTDENAKCDVLQDLTMAKLYEKFFATKCEIYKKEKIIGRMNHGHERIVEKAWENGHRKLAISTFVYGETCDLREIIDDLYRIGIVTKRNNEPASFIHHSFAAYFYAVDICDKIFNPNPDSKCPREWLMDVLKRSELKLIRLFLDNLLQIKWDGEKFPKFIDEEEMRNDEDMTDGIFHTCEENLVNILKLIFVIKGKKLPISIEVDKHPTYKFDTFDDLTARYKRGGDKEVSVLCIAATYGSFAVVNYLVMNIGVSNEKIKSALYLAVKYGHVEIVDFLFSRYEPGEGESRIGSLLHEAAYHGQLEVVKELLKHEKNLDLRNINKETPLHCAVYNGHLEIVKLFIEMGAKISVRDAHEKTLIHKANERHHEDVLKYILEKNLSGSGNETPPIVGNAATTYGSTALHLAAFSKDIGCLKILLERKICDLDLLDNDGETALHIAARISNLEAVKLLIEYKANVKFLNNNDHNPLQSLLSKITENLNQGESDCCYWNHDEFVELLKLLKEKIAVRTEKFTLNESSKPCENCKKILASVQKLFSAI